ncbi:Glyoxylase, beta-lactamase superfamily II [Oceanospirillum multiglobuliferum]|uniref:Metallo-beta-lactamase domain-containing protein n=1 Tax=Oceanospirillum multiglobuliferum TaxID=64969 RepID=A0A1T4LFL3_9GAMM|nr:MBL fold metallo-hydrolase [Oceanospirillum multiglobuliferum]OPX56676.1 hypothetical protein BTE48_01905 [Oceanospirillum multiglobuliferum]SJZ53549.1 Glyoxylase, beta-lactamase superfamily II [Oceanospirillum multiglobuliferum]
MRYEIIPVTAFQQNCTLLWCDKTKQAAVVDPGGDIDRILAKIEEHALTLTKILLTHGHIDHAGATSELAKRAGVEIEGPHQEDGFWLEGLAQQSQMFGFPPCEVFTPNRWLQDGDTVQVGEHQLEVLHCPGHTPGHVVFYHKDSALALVGDVLFQGSIGRTDFPKGDHATLIRSIREKLFPLGDDVVFIPGHGPKSSFGRERNSNPFCGDNTNR